MSDKVTATPTPTPAPLTPGEAVTAERALAKPRAIDMSDPKGSVTLPEMGTVIPSVTVPAAEWARTQLRAWQKVLQAEIRARYFPGSK